MMNFEEALRKIGEADGEEAKALLEGELDKARLRFNEGLVLNIAGFYRACRKENFGENRSFELSKIYATAMLNPMFKLTGGRG